MNPLLEELLLTTTGLCEEKFDGLLLALSAETELRLGKNYRLQTFPCHHFCLFSYVQRYISRLCLNSIGLTLDQRRRSTCPENGSRSHMRTEKVYPAENCCGQ